MVVGALSPGFGQSGDGRRARQDEFTDRHQGRAARCARSDADPAPHEGAVVRRRQRALPGPADTGCQLVELPGVDHVPWVGDAEAVLREVELFLTGTRGRPRGAAFGIGAQALTRREREIVRLAVEGQSALAIANRLYISDRTVETHLANAYIKLGVASRVELARRAEALGI
ncbi:MAG: helix-turn-helix transcriptional regulator [Chloroflexi bacterium]|nr:MAG: helix-turn-helix transcriptional regulator [Chloroflexota bacterium]